MGTRTIPQRIFSWVGFPNFIADGHKTHPYEGVIRSKSFAPVFPILSRIGTRPIPTKDLFAGRIAKFNQLFVRTGALSAKPCCCAACFQKVNLLATPFASAELATHDNQNSIPTLARWTFCNPCASRKAPRTLLRTDE